MEHACTVFTLLCVLVTSQSDPVARQNLPKLPPNTRRIISGKEVGETRPYMVYLRPSAQTDKSFVESNWLCGGVIVHPQYIITSAACIEDAKNFYVISGTNVWTPAVEETPCIKNGAKKAIWKCVPKDYYFDGGEFENIRWMSGDIAVVKVEDDFNFKKRVIGCEYIPKMIQFNNVSEAIAKPGIMGSVAGWGSQIKFADVIIGRSAENSLDLLESDVQIISKENCKKRWEQRYHSIIEESMICTKDDEDSSKLSKACIELGINCTEMENSAEKQDDKLTQYRSNDQKILEPSGFDENDDISNWTRRFKVGSGGFCENDHGGPLVVGHGATSMVVGIMSACLTKNVSRKCHGPYLYTSIWTYRNLISCAIDKDIGTSETCKRAFGDVRTFKNQISEVTFDWRSHENISNEFEKPTTNASEVSLPLELFI